VFGLVLAGLTAVIARFVIVKGNRK